MARKWIPTGTPGEFVRRAPDGEFEYKRVVRVKKTWDRNAEAQRDAKKKPSIADAKGGGRIIASMPDFAADEMREAAGSDPEQRQCWLRDHPEWCLVPKSQINAPKRKIVIY